MHRRLGRRQWAERATTLREVIDVPFVVAKMCGGWDGQMQAAIKGDVRAVCWIFDVIEVPAFFYLGLWFLLQFVSGHTSLASIPTHLTIVFGAHLAGFIAGGVWGLVERLREGQAGRRWVSEP